MSNMMSITDKIAAIRTDAEVKIVDAIWCRVHCINSLLDDAYGSGLGGHYDSALRCAADAVECIDELCDLLNNTTEQPLRENLRDAIGSINLDKFDFPERMRKLINLKMAAAVNGGKSPTLYVINTRENVYKDDDFHRLLNLLERGKVVSAMKFHNGKAWELNVDEMSWEYDADINPVSRPDLLKYCRK